MKLTAKRIKKLKSKIKKFDLYHADRFSAFKWHFETDTPNVIYGLDEFDAMRRYVKKQNRNNTWSDPVYHVYHEPCSSCATLAVVKKGIKSRSEIVWFSSYYTD